MDIPHCISIEILSSLIVTVLCLESVKHNIKERTSVYTNFANDYVNLNFSTPVIERPLECPIGDPYEKAQVHKKVTLDQIPCDLISLFEINSLKNSEKVRRFIIKNSLPNTEEKRAVLPLNDIDESLVVHSSSLGKRPAIKNSLDGQYVHQINALQDDNFEQNYKESSRTRKKTVFAKILKDESIPRSNNDFSLIKNLAPSENSDSADNYNNHERMPVGDKNVEYEAYGVAQDDHSESIQKVDLFETTIDTFTKDLQEMFEDQASESGISNLLAGLDSSDDYDYGLKDKANDTLGFVDYLRDIDGTTTRKPEIIVYKCYVCGMNCTTDIPLPDTCVNNASCGEQPQPWDMKDCIFNGTLLEPYEELDRLFGNWRAGCVKKFVDLNTIYTERSCLKQYNMTRGNPIYYNGTSIPSLRLAELEYFMENETSGCISAPFALLTPFGRFSLFSRFHVCVCSDYHYCNTAAQFQLPFSLFILILGLLLSRNTCSELLPRIDTLSKHQ